MRLIVRDLSKAYGFSWALKDLTLDLTAGDLIALLGPNGAGKTTVLKLLAGLAHATSGEIVFDGEPGLRGQGGERSIVGFLTPASTSTTILPREKISSSLLRSTIETAPQVRSTVHCQTSASPGEPTSTSPRFRAG